MTNSSQLKNQDLNCPEPFGHVRQCSPLRVPWFCLGRAPDLTEPVSVSTTHPFLGVRNRFPGKQRAFSGPIVDLREYMRWD